MISCWGACGLTELAIAAARPLTVLAEFSRKWREQQNFLLTVVFAVLLQLLLNAMSYLGTESLDITIMIFFTYKQMEE